MSSQTANDFLIRVDGLRKDYPTRGEALVVLDGLDLAVRAGESVAIMGPSGSGKSTLLHILGTLERPSRGQITLANQDPFALNNDQLADFRNRQLGFVFQDHQLLPQCSALENVLIPTLVHPGDRREAAERARRLLDLVGLAERIDYHPGELSGGERQRVAIARALVNRPPILLCDEPTGNLDEASAARVGECFSELQKAERITLVVITHNAAFAARFDRIHQLHGGRLSA